MKIKHLSIPNTKTNYNKVANTVATHMALLPYFDLLGTCARIEFGNGIYTMPKNDMQCIQIEQIQGKLENEYPTLETLSDHFNSIVDPEFIAPLFWGFIPTRKGKKS